MFKLSQEAESLVSLQVEVILDKENFTLEELLDEEEIIQECKALNSRLINLYVRNQFQIMDFYFSCPWLFPPCSCVYFWFLTKVQ